jgi:hypothetical protein
MSDVTAQPAPPPVRASDADREQTVALLQRSFADGRLTQAELEDRAAAAYAARTTTELHQLTIDLPAERVARRRGLVQDRRLLCILLCVHPPAALVYWLITRPRKRRPAPTSQTATCSGTSLAGL